MKGLPRVDILALNWNGCDDTLRGLRSLRDQSYGNFRIVVIDNGSIDGSPERLRAEAGISLIELPANLGYTGGNNYGMRHAFADGADYVWLFNNDATAEPDTLAMLVAAAEADSRIGLASPVIRPEDDPRGIQYSAGLFDLSVPTYLPGYSLEQGETWQAEHPDRIVLSGAAMLVSRSLYERIGDLDDRLFAYWEDVEYSIRSASNGFRNVMVSHASVLHASKTGIAAPEKVKPHYYYFMARNEILMWRRLCRGALLLKAVIWVLQKQLRQLELMPGYAAGVEAVLSGLWDGCRGIGGAYGPRRRMPQPFRYLLHRHPRACQPVLGLGR